MPNNNENKTKGVRRLGRFLVTGISAYDPRWERSITDATRRARRALPFLSEYIVVYIFFCLILEILLTLNAFLKKTNHGLDLCQYADLQQITKKFRKWSVNWMWTDGECFMPVNTLRVGWRRKDSSCESLSNSIYVEMPHRSQDIWPYCRFIITSTRLMKMVSHFQRIRFTKRMLDKDGFDASTNSGSRKAPG